MEVYCTRPGCPRPVNHFADLDNNATLKTVQQKFCTTCGMPLILIGRYLPISLLGKGGFGAAFLSRDRYTPGMRQCVVKQFQPSGDLSPAQLKVAQELFEREGEVLETLGNRHPEIPDLLAFFELDVPSAIPGKTDQFFYLVQEFIDGENMEEELARKGQLSEAEVVEVLTAILKILKFVHDNGSIHRDIKPSNIMRHRDGRIYLLDFGAVKQVTSGAGSAAGSNKGSTGIYSMGFAPPEQMAGNVVYPATDLYALGVTCITLLTGKQPNELYDPYINGWNWRAFAPVSDRLEAVLNRMLLASPSQRFQSAEEVLEALKPPARPAPPPPPPMPLPSPSPPPGSSSKRRTTASGSAAAAAQPQPAVSVPSPQPNTQPPNPQPLAPNPSSPSFQPVPAPATRPNFSTLEILSGAAFAGFEGGLLAIATLSFLGTLVGGGIWLALMGFLVFAQTRRWIEKIDLIIIAVISLLVAIAIQSFKGFAILQAIASPIPALVFFAVLTGLVAIAVTILFQLIYRILSSFL
jgi:serine/threonine-protein kinase